MAKFPKPVTKNCTKIIYDQMDNYFYVLQGKNGKLIFGFFSYIKCDNNKIPVLITDNKILNDISDNLIDISTNKIIEIDDIIFNDEKNEIAIIGIKENMIKNLNFLDLDERLYDEEFKLYSDEDSIYIIHYDNKNILVSYGIINNINKSEMRISVNINSKVKMCPIFNLSNNKIIGVLKYFSKCFNKGIFINNIINKFINYIRNKNKIKLFNEIQI